MKIKRMVLRLLIRWCENHGEEELADVFLRKYARLLGLSH